MTQSDTENALHYELSQREGVCVCVCGGGGGGGGEMGGQESSLEQCTPKYRAYVFTYIYIQGVYRVYICSNIHIQGVWWSRQLVKREA